MKILNVSSSVGIGGREILVMTLSESLRAAGCEVRLITAHDTWLDRRATGAGFVNYRLPMKKYVDLYSIAMIGRILRDYRPDVVHLYFISDIWLVVPAVKLFYPKARVFLLRSMESSNMKDFARTALFNALDRVIVMSDFLKHDFLAKTRVPPGKVETIYIGVDLEKFTSAAAAENVLKRDYRLPADAVVVGLVGRIDTGKGQDKFVEAARGVIDRVRPRSPELADRLRFLVVGSSEKGAGIAYENALKQRVGVLGMADRFVFTGFREDIPAVMGSLDVAVFPSRNEAFGLVVIEAMAMSRAVVGFNRGAFPEIIVQDENGFIVEYDAESLADGIAALVLDEGRRREFGARGRRLVETKFDLKTTIRKFLALYAG